MVCLRLMYFSVLISSRRSDEHPVVGLEDDAQLVLARAVHPDLVGRVRVLRGDEVDRELLLRPVDLVVELEAEREVLAVLGVADLAGLDDVAGQDLEQPGADLGGVDVDVLDLLLDDLLFVGQVLVDVAVALDVGLRLQQRQRLLDLLRQRRQVEAEAVVDEHGEVARGGLEALDVLDQEQRLEQADRELVVEVALGDVDRALRRGLQRGADAGEHAGRRWRAWPTSTLPMSLATCWTTPSIDRSPTELLRPSKTLWSEMPSIAAWNSGNW